MLDVKSFFIGIFFCIFIAVVAIASSSLFFPQNNFSFGNFACTNVSPLFSPGSTDDISSLINGAQKEIDVEMYVFTDERIAQALTDAASRGVRVRVILEPRTNAYNLDTIAGALESGGVELRWASLSYQLTHAKMMIIDGKKVLVGSINFSKAAQEKNREAAVVLEGKEVQQYIDVFEKDWKMASALKGNKILSNATDEGALN